MWLDGLEILQSLSVLLASLLLASEDKYGKIKVNKLKQLNYYVKDIKLFEPKIFSETCFPEVARVFWTDYR